MTTMMKAIAFQPKSTKAKIVQVPKPVPEDDEVLVQVKYSALDTALDDVINKTFIGGFVHKSVAKDEPLLCAWHYSGVVQGMGANVTKFKAGDAVYGHLQYAPETSQGSCAEFIVVKAQDTALKPRSVNFSKAAAAATEALTALQAIRDEGGLKPSSETKGKEQQTILINGAGGQVGALAVQWAKQLLGAHVTAVCRTKDVDRLKNQLGADVVIDRKAEPQYWESFAKEQFDVIFDTPNALSYPKMFRHVKPHGTIVSTLPTWSLLWGMMYSMFTKGKQIKMVGVHAKQADLELLGKYLEQGKLTVDIDSTYDVKDIEQAASRNRDPSKKGRVVIQVENGW